MLMNRLLVSVFFYCVLFKLNANAFNPAVIYDTAGKFDKSFSQSVWEGGISVYNEKYNTKIVEYTPKNDTQREQGLTRFARKNHSPIVVVGSAFSQMLKKVALEYPKINFIFIDGDIINLPNVLSLQFAEHEGSFLVGALAALYSQTHVVGFIGGMDLPIISKFSCGYKQGVKYVDENAKVLVNVIGSTPAAFSDPVKGQQIAKLQIENKVDIIYSAAALSGNGIFQAAKDNGIFGVGVDSNQNYLYPGTILTSMVKNTGALTLQILEEVNKNDYFKGGVYEANLKNNGVYLAVDKYNESVIVEEKWNKLQQLKQDIINGKIVVHNFLDNLQCNL